MKNEIHRFKVIVTSMIAMFKCRTNFSEFITLFDTSLKYNNMIKDEKTKNEGF